MSDPAPTRMHPFGQAGFDVRFDWGLRGLRAISGASCVVVIVDVLSFTTSVSIAVERGVTVFPYRWRDSSAAAFAGNNHAELAVGRREAKAGRSYSLSPASLLGIPQGARIVLPSPNGSTLAAEAAGNGNVVLAGCLRNSAAVARAATAVAARAGGAVAVIAAGERWPDDRTLRPSAEDLVGAGAIIDGLAGRKSPEASAAAGAFASVRVGFAEFLRHTGSGKELVEAGFENDVLLASELNVSEIVPILTDGAFTA